MSWLSFTFAAGAWFLAASVPLIILYFLKLKRPKLEIPSLVLWQSVVNDQRVNSPFQKFRRNLLLLLQLLLLFLIVLALMQPRVQSGAGASEYMPILVDCSASMGAKDEATGKTRLDLVKEQLLDRIDRLGPDQKLALFSFADTGRRLTEFTSDRRDLKRAVNALTASDLPGRLDDVLRMTAAYTRTFPIDRITVMTDGNISSQIDFELPFKIDVVKVDPPGPNIGITEFSARRSGPEDWEVFVRVAGASADMREGTLELYENGQKTADQKLEVAVDESQRLVFPVTTTEPTLLEARLVPTGFDSMQTDNSVWLTLPAARPLRVWVSSELNAWKHAVRVLTQVELAGAEGGGPGALDYDMVVSESEDIEGAESPVSIFVGVIPSDLAGIVELREEIATVVDWNRTSPLLRHVQLGDVQVGESPAYIAGKGVKDLEERGYEVLIDGNLGPLLVQRREGLHVAFYFLFHTDRSTLPYRLGFPIMVANGVEASLKQAALSEVASAPTGVLPALSVEPDREYRVRGPGGDEVTLRSSGGGMLSGAAAGTVGRYDILDGADVITSIGTGLLNPLESSLAQVQELQFTEVTVKSEEGEVLDSDFPLWWTAALIAFGLMLYEWWYFQRGRGVMT
ncbi:MAG: BatA and WFA domain-containing protein [Planctomyces sp.]|nr:BatA and WFA domain-containing protein [Planctomyces sp.]